MPIFCVPYLAPCSAVLCAPKAISALQSRASLLHAQVDSALAQQQQHSQDLTHKARALATALQAAPLPPPPSTQPHPMLEWLRSLNDQSGLAQALHEARALLTERGEGREGLHVELCPPSTRGQQTLLHTTFMNMRVYIYTLYTI